MAEILVPSFPFPVIHSETNTKDYGLMTTVLNEVVPPARPVTRSFGRVIGALASGSVGVPSDFFRMHTIYRNDPWPTVSLGGMAKGAALTWNYIQTSSGGAYNWTELDAWVALAQAHNFIDSFFFDIINPPSWTSWAALASDPAPLVAFTTDLVARYKGIIKNYEIANEPLETQGVTPTQLAITVAAVIPVIRAGDPAARILAPTMYARSEQQANWNNYYSIGGSAVEDVDIVTIHGYPSPGDCRPEAIDLNYTGTKPIFALYSSFVPTSLLGKPVWNTEGSWGSEATGQTIPTNQDQQAAFLARYVLLHWSNNIKACCWYAWPSGSAGTTSQVWGRLAGRLAATAWQQVYNWMLGATLTNPIRADGTVWSGSWTRPGGYRAVCVWDVGTTGYDGSSSYTVPAGMNFYRDVDGVSHAVTPGDTVTIGMKPLWFATNDLS